MRQGPPLVSDLSLPPDQRWAIGLVHPERTLPHALLPPFESGRGLGQATATATATAAGAAAGTARAAGAECRD